MDEPANPGQGRTEGRKLLARAARALAEDGALSTEGLLAIYRAAAPTAHAGAALDTVDVAFLARARARGGDALLGARTVRVTAAPWRAPWRFSALALDSVELAAPPCEDLPGDALLLLAGLALEAAKLAHGLSVPPDALRAAFATPAAAQGALASLRAGGDARILELAACGMRVDPAALAALVGDRPAYLIAGAGAERVHDLLSPFARRLRGPLIELAARAPSSSSKDDAVYQGMSALFATDPALLQERLDAERADAWFPLGPGALALRCEALSDGEVDRRARESAAQLKRARALLVLVEPRAASVDVALRALGRAARAVAVLTHGNSACTPSALVDEATGHTALFDNALPDAARTLRSLPSLALADGGPDRDAGVFALAQPIFAARAAGVLDERTRIAIRSAPHDDASAMSAAALDLLARFAPKAQARPRPR